MIVPIRTAATVVALAAGLAAASARAEVAAGIVLDVKGSASPAVASLSEMEAGQKVALGADGRMTLVHYRSCRTLTVVGGSVTFNLTQLIVEGGRIEDEKKRCPKRFALADGGATTAGGLVLRGGTPADARQMSPRPIIVLAGPRAAGIGEAELRGPGGTVARWPAGSRRLELPASGAALQAGASYDLVLRSKSGGGEETHKLVVAAAASQEAVDNTVILSLD